MQEANTNPLRIGRALTLSAYVLWQNFQPFALLALLSYAPAILIDAIVPAPDPLAAGDPLPSHIAWSVLVLGLAALALSAYLSAVVSCKSVADLCATPMRHPEARRDAWNALPAVLGLISIVVLIGLAVTFIAAIVWAVASMLTTGDPTSSLGSALLPLIAVPAFVLVVLFAVAIPAAVVENLGATDALRRSVALTAGSRWQIAGILVVLGVLGFIANAIPFGITTLLFGIEATATTVSTLVGLPRIGPLRRAVLGRDGRHLLRAARRRRAARQHA